MQRNASKTYVIRSKQMKTKLPSSEGRDDEDTVLWGGIMAQIDRPAFKRTIGVEIKGSLTKTPA